MPARFSVHVQDFRGIKSDTRPGRLPPEYAELDEGSDHSTEGSWKLRRGMTRTAAAKASAGLIALGGFETINGSFSFWLVDENGTFTGYPTVAFGGDAGFGEGGEGEGGFGT